MNEKDKGLIDLVIYSLSIVTNAFVKLKAHPLYSDLLLQYSPLPTALLSITLD